MQSSKWELYEYQRSRSVIDLGPNHLHSIFLNFFSSIIADFNISSAIRWAIQDQWSSGFSCNRIFNTSNTKKCKKQCLNFTKPCQIFRCFVFPRRHEQRKATLSSQCMGIVRVESDLRTSKKYFIDVLMFPLFGKISWRKKWLSSVKLKTKSEELECVIFILSFNLPHHSFYTGYITICEDFYPLNGRRRRTLPYPYTIYMYCWTYSTW